MTAATGSGTDPHPEVAEISDLTEGLLPPARGAEVREHLADCALCADVLASLQEIHSLLGTLPEPPSIPADVAGRIDAALAAEARLDTVLPGPRVPRGTSSTAAVPRETSPVAELSGRRPRWRSGLLAAAAVAGVVLIGGALHEMASRGGSDAADTKASSAKQSLGDATTDDQVAAQVRRLLAQPSAAGSVPDGQTPMLSGNASAGANGVEAAPAVPACVLLATQRTQPPVAAEREVFQGSDSYLVVLSHPGDADLVDAYVVGADCSASSPGNVLFQRSYPR